MTLELKKFDMKSISFKPNENKGPVVVLIGKRDFQDNKGDIIQKYFPDEAKNLKDYGELPTNVFINEGKIIKNEEFSEDCLDQAFEFDSNSEKKEKTIIE
jgi:translation initiation factor 1A